MQKSRKTRKEKIRSAFRVKEEWLTKNNKNIDSSNKYDVLGTKFLRQDLTKTFVLTMLVLALELALWLYLSGR